MFILYFQYISVQTSYILSAQQLRAASDHHII